VDTSFRFACSIFLAASFLAAWAQSSSDNGVTREPDQEMAAHIYAAKAFDNHAHPVLPPPNDRTDRDFDALPVDNMEPATDVVAWRADNPQLPAAWKVLWNYDAPASFLAPLNADAMKRLAAARAAVQAREGPRSRSSTILACDIPTLFYYMVAVCP
jgi:hypothetical protein